MTDSQRYSVTTSHLQLSSRYCIFNATQAPSFFNAPSLGVLELRPGFGAKLSGDLFASGYHRRRDLSQLSASTMAANILAENSQR